MRRLALAICLVLTLAACGGRVSAAGPAGAADRPNPPLETAEIALGTATLKAEIADNETERSRGLMFRKSLAEGRGMLFVFDTDQRVSFWMKNTSLPLSIAYISADGTLTQILDLVPFSETPRPSERSVRYALEVPQGWFARAGVRVGDRMVRK